MLLHKSLLKYLGHKLEKHGFDILALADIWKSRIKLNNRVIYFRRGHIIRNVKYQMLNTNGKREQIVGNVNDTDSEETHRVKEYIYR